MACVSTAGLFPGFSYEYYINHVPSLGELIVYPSIRPAFVSSWVNVTYKQLKVSGVCM